MRFHRATLSLTALLLVTSGCEEVKSFVLGDATGLAKKRVSLVLEGSVGGMDDQRAISQYYKGIDLITGPELESALDDYTRWLNQKGLGRRIKTWEVVGAEQLEDVGAQATTVVVTAKINGETYKLRVPEREPITWAK